MLLCLYSKVVLSMCWGAGNVQESWKDAGFSYKKTHASTRRQLLQVVTEAHTAFLLHLLQQKNYKPTQNNQSYARTMVPIASLEKQTETLFRLICWERKTLFSAEKQAEKTDYKTSEQGQCR